MSITAIAAVVAENIFRTPFHDTHFPTIAKHLTGFLDKHAEGFDKEGATPAMRDAQHASFVLKHPESSGYATAVGGAHDVIQKHFAEPGTMHGRRAMGLMNASRIYLDGAKGKTLDHHIDQMHKHLGEAAVEEAEGAFTKHAEFVSADGKHAFRAGKNKDYGTWDDRHYVKSDKGAWTHVKDHGYDGHDSKEDAVASAKGNRDHYDAHVAKQGAVKEASIEHITAPTVDENVSPLAKAVGKSIKSWGKEIGAPLRVRSLGGKSQFVQAWQHADPSKDGIGGGLVFSHPIPEEHRKKALKIIYPNHPELHNQTAAGNVSAGAITMHAHQWHEFFKGTPHEIKGAEAPVSESNPGGRPEVSAKRAKALLLQHAGHERLPRMGYETKLMTHGDHHVWLVNHSGTYHIADHGSVSKPIRPEVAQKLGLKEGAEGVVENSHNLYTASNGYKVHHQKFATHDAVDFIPPTTDPHYKPRYCGTLHKGKVYSNQGGEHHRAGMEAAWKEYMDPNRPASTGKTESVQPAVDENGVKKNADIHGALSASLGAAGLDGNGRFRSPGHALSVLADTLAKHGLEFGSSHTSTLHGDDGSAHVPVAWKNSHEPLAPKDEEHAGIHFTWHKHDQSPTGSHEALAYATGPLHPPHAHEFLNFKQPYAVQSDRTGFIHSTHDTHADATAAKEQLYKKHKLYANVVPSASALQRRENAGEKLAVAKVQEDAGFPDRFHWKSVGKDDLVERVEHVYRVTKKDGRKGTAFWEGTEYHTAVRHLGALAKTRGTVNERMGATSRATPAPEVKDHTWKASNGYSVNYHHHPGAGLEVGVASPEGHHVGGVHGGQLFVKKTKIMHREGASKAWQQYKAAHPKHPVDKATFGGCADESVMRVDVAKIADPQSKRVIEWRILRADLQRVVVEHPDTHREHAFPLSAIVG